MTRGSALPDASIAFTRKRLAAAVSRLAINRKSIVWPVESRARYRYRSSPLILIYVSSIRYDLLVGRRCGRHRFFELGRIRLYPAPDAARIHCQTALGQHLGDVLIRQWISQIPAHGQQNDLARIVTPFEGVDRPA